jgi:galactokinase
MLEYHVDNVKNNFEATFNQEVELISAAPGRINIIGEHTDYNFGLAMPTAINRYVILGFSFNDSNTVRLFSESFNSELTFELDKDPNPFESWQKYLVGAINIFKQSFKIGKGFNVYVWGDVPLGSGVSSSAAIEVAMMNLLRKAFKAKFTDIELVLKCQQIEHQYLNVKSGLLDQYASMFSVGGKLMVLDFKSLDHTYIDVNLKGYQWVLVNTKVKRELSSSKYSERVAETQEALSFIKQVNPKVSHFRDVSLADLSVLHNEVLRKRMHHFVTENQRVLDLAVAFKANDIKKVGDILIEGHVSLRDDYEVSCQELDFLVEKAKQFEGFLGGRMMGGGFGGCTINLIESDKVQQFKDYILPIYKDKFHIEGEFMVFDSVNGAEIVEL